MKKKNNLLKRSILSTVLGISILTAGAVSFVEQNEEIIAPMNFKQKTLKNNLSPDALFEIKDVSTKLMINGELEVEFSIYGHGSNDGLPFKIQDVVDEIYNLKIYTFENGETNIDDAVEVFEFDSTEYERYFEIVDDNTESSELRVRTYLDLQNGSNWVSEVKPYVSTEQYQIGVMYSDSFDEEEFYLSSIPFRYFDYGVDISEEWYDGVNQSIAKISFVFSDWGLFEGDYDDVSGLEAYFSQLNATWGSEENISLLKYFDDKSKSERFVRFEVIKDETTDDVKGLDFYFIFDEVEEDEKIQLSLDYKTNFIYFGGAEGELVFEHTFKKHTYDTPTLSAGEVKIGDLNSIDNPKYFNDAAVNIGLTYDDKSFPSVWNEISDISSELNITSEVEFDEVVDSIELNSVSSKTSDSEYENVPVEEVPFEVVEPQDKWNEEGEVSETYLVFEDLEKDTEYKMTFKVNFKNAEVFGVDSVVSNEIEFNTYKTLSEPKLSIDSWNAPTLTQTSMPADWNKLTMDVSISAPTSTWSDHVVNVEDIFDRVIIEAKNVESEEEEVVTKEIENFTEIGTQTITLEKLDSEAEYTLQAKAYYSDEYAKIFGVEPGSSCDSEVITDVFTNDKVEMPEVVFDDSLHEAEVADGVGEVITTGFEIVAPSSWGWNFNLDTKSAFNLDKIFTNAYITNVQKETLSPTDEDELLKEQIFEIEKDLSWEELNVIQIGGGEFSLEANKNYTYDLVIELTEQASCELSGWIETSTSTKPWTYDEEAKTISISHSNFTGEVDKAPEITISNLTSKQSSYNTHEASFDYKITLPAGVTQEEFESKMSSYNVLITYNLSTNGEVIEEETFRLEDIISKCEFASGAYSGSYNQLGLSSGLTGDTEYDLDFNVLYDESQIEEITIPSSSFTTEPNEVLGVDELGLMITEGVVNEEFNVVEGYELDISTIDDSGKSKNIVSYSIVDSDGNEVVKVEDEIWSLTSGEDVYVELENKLLPNTTYDLTGYKILVENDEYSGETEVMDLTKVLGFSTFTTKGLGDATISSAGLELTSYKNSIKAEWEVSEMNNIEDATITLFEESSSTDEDTIVDEYTYTSESFQTNEESPTGYLEDWSESYNFDEIKDGKTYYATLEWNTLDSVDATTKLHQATSEEILFENPEVSTTFEVSVDESKIGYEEFVVDYNWSSNDSANKVEEATINIWDKNVESKEVVWSETQTIEGISGSSSFNVSNDGLVEKMIESNQEYDFEIICKDTNEREFPINKLMDGDMVSGVKTIEKERNFNEDLREISQTEDSFTIGYGWENKTIDSGSEKNVISQEIELYSIDEDGEELIGEPLLIESIEESHSEEQITINDELISGIEISPSKKFKVKTNVVFDTRETGLSENETFSTELEIAIHGTSVVIESQSDFIDNDSIVSSIELNDSETFFEDSENELNIQIADKNGKVDFDFEGKTYSAEEGLTLNSTQIKNLAGVSSAASSAKFEVQLDNLYTSPGDEVKLILTYDSTDGEKTNVENVVNEITPNALPEISVNEFGVLERYQLESGDFVYEIKTDSNYGFSEFNEVFFTNKTDRFESDAMKIVNDEESYELEDMFGNINDKNIYLWVNQDEVEGMGFNDLSFLVGRSLYIDFTDIKNNGEYAGTELGTEFSKEIEGFVWMWPPKTFEEIVVEVFYFFILFLLITGLVMIASYTGYTILKKNVSNKTWSNNIRKMAIDNFNEVSKLAKEYGWSPKYEEFSNLLKMTKDELLQYSIDLNIPVEFNSNKLEMAKTISMLTEEELDDYYNFIDYDIKIRDYEVYDKYAEERLKPHHFWLQHKLNQLSSSLMFKDEDVDVLTLHSELKNLEEQKEEHKEKEILFNEMKDLLGTFFNEDVSNEDVLTLFKAEVAKNNNNDEKVRSLEDIYFERDTQVEETSFEELEVTKKKIELLERARILEEEMERTHPSLNSEIINFNSESTLQVDSERTLSKTKLELNRRRKELLNRKEEFEKLKDELHQTGLVGEVDSFELPDLNQINISISQSQIDKMIEDLEGKTKQELVAIAIERDVEFKTNWTKLEIKKVISNNIKNNAK